LHLLLGFYLQAGVFTRLFATYNLAAISHFFGVIVPASFGT
jgi:hypothetical protein